MNQQELITFIADKLREGESVDRVTKMIRGMQAAQARDLVLKVRTAMKWNVRKSVAQRFSSFSEAFF
jgi:hypothetical protein